MGYGKTACHTFVRWLEYDRSGLGRSEDPPVAPEEITAVSVATELDILLKTAGGPVFGRKSFVYFAMCNKNCLFKNKILDEK